MTINEAILEMAQLKPLSIPAVNNGAIWFKLDDLVKILEQIDGADISPLITKGMELREKFNNSQEDTH